jgi:hypothetical protein
MSYQQVGPQRIEQLGVSPEELARQKTNRRLLFTGISVILLLTFSVMAVVVKGHTGQVQDFNDSQDFGVASLSALHDRTNASVVSTGCETTILVMRHCEKEGPEVVDPDGNQHCSYLGHERAHFLPTLFGGDDNKYPVPSMLYALAAQRKHEHFNFREIETLVPLANKYGLPIQADYGSNTKLVKHMFHRIASGEMCGKLALVSWKHDMIGDLARTLACPTCPRFYPEDVYDEVWQLKYVYDVQGTAVISAVNHNHGIPTNNNGDDRQLRKKHHKSNNDDKREWTVYSTITKQNFDPLKFSFRVGDYDGSASGGSWFAPDDGEM